MGIKYLDDEKIGTSTSSGIKYINDVDIQPSTEKPVNNTLVKDVGILDQIFVEPSASGTRELIRKGNFVGKIAGILPAGLGSNLLASTGLLGKENQRIVNEAFIDPATSDSFQIENIKKTHDYLAERAGRRTGILSQQKPLGKFLLFSELAIAGNNASGFGVAKDMWTNPVDTLFSLLDFTGIGKAAKLRKIPLDVSTKSSISKKISSMFRIATGRGSKGVKTSAQIANDNKKIVVGLDAIADTVKSQGKIVNSAEDALNAAADAKKLIRSEYDALRKSAQEGGAMIDLRIVADDLINSQNTQAAGLVNKNIQKRAFDISEKYYGTKKVSLDTAEEMVRRLNAQRPATLGASIDDISNAQLNETIATSLRNQLDNVIFNATGDNYKPLKAAYGSILDIESDIAKSVQKAGKNSNITFVRQLSESIDNVPLIYGILSGNIPLAGAALLQKSGKVVINKTLRDTNKQFSNIFKYINKVKNPAMKIKETPIGSTIRNINRSNHGENNELD